MEIDLIYGDEPVKCTVNGKNDHGVVQMADGSSHQISVNRDTRDLLTIDTGSQTFQAAVVTQGGKTTVSYNGRIYKFTSPEIARLATKRVSSGTLVAPMTGVISSISVAVGETVKAYQALAVMEAMKVMATLEAPFDGTVEAINFTKGQQVGHGDTILVIAPDPVPEQDGEKDK